MESKGEKVRSYLTTSEPKIFRPMTIYRSIVTPQNGQEILVPAFNSSTASIGRLPPHLGHSHPPIFWLISSMVDIIMALSSPDIRILQVAPRTLGFHLSAQSHCRPRRSWNPLESRVSSHASPQESIPQPLKSSHHAQELRVVA